MLGSNTFYIMCATMVCMPMFYVHMLAHVGVQAADTMLHTNHCARLKHMRAHP
jgi:hypothetical protein